MTNPGENTIDEGAGSDDDGASGDNDNTDGYSATPQQTISEETTGRKSCLNLQFFCHCGQIWT